MQTCFIYQADIWCNDCGNGIIDRLEARGKPDTEDSDTFPQEETISESDTPSHCAGCGCFLDNPLTHDGLAYVQRALDEHGATGKGNREVLQQWARRYGFHNAGVLNV